VKLVDLNLLLYAVNEAGPYHEQAKTWLEETLAAEEPVAMPWVVLLGFLRLATSPRVFPKPLTTDQAVEIVDGWLERPNVSALSPGAEHWRILKELIGEAGTAGNLATDSHLAALAIELGATLCSTDPDFARFRRVRWVNPLANQ
jgi:uncharacterized protein